MRASPWRPWCLGALGVGGLVVVSVVAVVAVNSSHAAASTRTSGAASAVVDGAPAVIIDVGHDPPPPPPPPVAASAAASVRFAVSVSMSTDAWTSATTSGVTSATAASADVDPNAVDVAVAGGSIRLDFVVGLRGAATTPATSWMLLRCFLTDADAALACPNVYASKPSVASRATYALEVPVEAVLEPPRLEYVSPPSVPPPSPSLQWEQPMVPPSPPPPHPPPPQPPHPPNAPSTFVTVRHNDDCDDDAVGRRHLTRNECEAYALTLYAPFEVHNGTLHHERGCMQWSGNSGIVEYMYSAHPHNHPCPNSTLVECFCVSEA